MDEQKHQPTLALMIGKQGEGHPIIFLIAGITYRLQVTSADTGFPGKPKNSFPALLFTSDASVAKVVGFLGGKHTNNIHIFFFLLFNFSHTISGLIQISQSESVTDFVSTALPAVIK